MEVGKGLIVDELSFSSIKISVLRGEIILGTATGFAVRWNGALFLVTTWHVVTGRHAQTGACIHNLATEPDAIAVDHHQNHLVGRWVRVRYPLFDANGPMWLEHPSGCGHIAGVDLVALPIQNPEGTMARPLKIAGSDAAALEMEAGVRVAAPVHVIGFPKGYGNAGQWPLWLTGHIASDPELDFDRLPRFLVDVRTRGGMSGSPVVIRTSRFIGGEQHTAKFLGIYSGRVHEDLDLGYVWRPQALRELLERRRDESAPRRFNPGAPGDDQPVAGAEPGVATRDLIDFDAAPDGPARA